MTAQTVPAQTVPAQTVPAPTVPAPTVPAQTVPDVDVIDAHVHFWDPDRLDYAWLASVPALNRAFLPEHLPQVGDQRRGIVFVQADCRSEQAQAEVDWVRGLRQADAPILAAVAHAPLEYGTEAEQRVGDLAADPLVSGVRRLLQDEGDGFALAEGFLAGCDLLARAGMPLDVCIREHQLPEVTELARRRPDLTLILDHLGKPEVSPESIRSWARGLERLAALPNVTCKLSGLPTQAAPQRRTARDLLPYLRQAIEVFGPRRCMFGSDWPVLTTAMPYAQWLDLVSEAINDLAAEERIEVMRGTAARVYGVGGTSGVSGGVSC